MKWIVGYVAAAALLLAPMGLRLWTRSEPAPKPLAASAVEQGKVLFTHEWTVNDPLCPDGDGLGPVFNAKSCAVCHHQGGLGGGGGLEHNVTTFVSLSLRGDRAVQGVVHAQATSAKFQENLKHVSPNLPAHINPKLKDIQDLNKMGGRQGIDDAQIGQRNTPALFGAKLIDDLPEHAILANERAQKLRWRMPVAPEMDAPVGRALRLGNGKIGKFGWKAQSASMFDFVQAACANELGLGNPGQGQPAPLGFANYKAPGLDLTNEQCEQMTAFVLALPRPVERQPLDARGRERVAHGKQLFNTTGCVECHVPNLGSLEGVYSDFLLHRMGQELSGDNGSYNGPPPGSESPGDTILADEWRTPPLWGVADSAPYLHDGRARTLDEAIRMHGGQGQGAVRRFDRLSPVAQEDLILFLKSLRAPG